jgi:hypothetical protein
MRAVGMTVVDVTPAAVYRKVTVRIDISDSDGDDFLRNLLTTRCEERVLFAIYMPPAFARVVELGA